MNHLFFTTSCYYFTILVGWSPMFVATQKRSHCWWFTQVSGWICTTYNWTNHDKPSTHPAYFMPNFGAPSLNLPSRWFAKKCSRWDIYPLGEYIHLFIYYLQYIWGFLERIQAMLRMSRSRKKKGLAYRRPRNTTCHRFPTFIPVLGQAVWSGQFKHQKFGVNRAINRGFDQETWEI